MTCEEVRESMAEYLDELLPLERKLALEHHLQGCVGCRQLITETKTALQWLQQAEELTPPANLRSSVIRTLQQEKQIRRTRLAPGLVQIVAAAAVFVLLIAGNLLLFADNGFLRTRGNTEGVVTYNQEIDISSAAEDEIRSLETAGESEQSPDYGELAAVNEQRQVERTVQQRFTPRFLVNLVLSTVIIILLMISRKKRRELLP